jgi:hypothetical protein
MFVEEQTPAGLWRSSQAGGWMRFLVEVFRFEVGQIALLQIRQWSRGTTIANEEKHKSFRGLVERITVRRLFLLPEHGRDSL